MNSCNRNFSSIVVDGNDRAPNRSMLRAVGFEDEDFEKPQVAVCSAWSMVTPCNSHLDELGKASVEGVDQAGGKAVPFGTITVSDGISMGTPGMRYSLVSREVIADSIETVVGAEGMDGLVAIGGCDKNMPACVMALARLNRPGIFVYGGTILPGLHKEKNLDIVSVFEAVGSHAGGVIDKEELTAIEKKAIPGPGSCGGMYTANTMSSAIEALGMSLPGGAIIPAPYKEREIISFETGKRIVEMVHEDLTPSKIMTKKAFENAIYVASAIGASSNCPPHLTAIARHMGIDFGIDNWEKLGHDIPLLVNCQPAGEHLMEGFFKAGGIPAIMQELMKNNKLHKDLMTVTGKTIAENLIEKIDIDENIIKSFKNPLVNNAGFIVMKSNFFNSAVMKTSVISSEFRKRYLSNPTSLNLFEANAVVFEGPEDYHLRINDESLNIDENSILMIRGCGPVGYPGSAEVVNMQPPDKLLKQGINTLPTLGDGRQSGTSESPSILNVSPESAIGGSLLIVETGDKIKIDLNNSRIDLMISSEEIEKRRKKVKIPKLENQTPWQEISRKMVGQLETGACLETETLYLDITNTKGMPRHSH